MASQAPAPPQEQGLPLFYKSLVPLSSQLHASHRLVRRDTTDFARGAHAIPITVDEFVAAQRFYPIVFGQGPSPAPLALVGLSEGRNLFIGEDGRWRPDAYVPAYVRRYPFLLAKLTDTATDLSLCFDDSADIVVPGQVVPGEMVAGDGVPGREGAGEPLFDEGQPTDVTKAALGFCEQFEQAVHRTRAFVEELQKLELLTDGEVTLQHPSQEQPAVYRGFRMIAEEKVKELRGDQLRKLTQNSGLGLIYAHIFSLSQVREIFEMQRRGERRT